ncbi:MAG: hypothetical protein QNJ31_08385 [Candidatus Caenarcaniphilales bacterium]|nr:hypothetical protein [Candidatus Caenarcaniphilales bacterium]
MVSVSPISNKPLLLPQRMQSSMQYAGDYGSDGYPGGGNGVTSGLSIPNNLSNNFQAPGIISWATSHLKEILIGTVSILVLGGGGFFLSRRKGAGNNIGSGVGGSPLAGLRNSSNNINRTLDQRAKEIINAKRSVNEAVARLENTRKEHNIHFYGTEEPPALNKSSSWLGAIGTFFGTLVAPGPGTAIGAAGGVALGSPVELIRWTNRHITFLKRGAMGTVDRAKIQELKDANAYANQQLSIYEKKIKDLEAFDRAQKMNSALFS